MTQKEMVQKLMEQGIDYDDAYAAVLFNGKVTLPDGQKIDYRKVLEDAGLTEAHQEMAAKVQSEKENYLKAQAEKENYTDFPSEWELRDGNYDGGGYQ